MNKDKSSLPQVNPAKHLDIYDANSIIVLPGLEAVRQNPSMYIGSTDLDGLHQLLYEVLYNSIDESLAGFCSKINIILNTDGSCLVEDDGRGIPVDLHPSEGRPALEIVLTTLHAGGKFKPGSYLRTAGIHGVGISCVNALSEWLIVDVFRQGNHFQQRFARGKIVSGLKNLGPSEKRGTRITFMPDPTIFHSIQGFSHEILTRRLEELAFLNKNILIHLEDHLQQKHQDFQHNNGILGFVAHLNKSRMSLHEPPVHIEYFSPDMEFDLAIQWTTEYQEDIHSYVNNIHTVYGGTHVLGLKSALTKAINTYIDENKLGNSSESERITTFDIWEGATCVLSVKMDHPQFEGQTKTRLTNHEVQILVENVVSTEFLKVLRKDSKLALGIINKALNATRARLAARMAHENFYIQNSTTRGISEEVYQKQFGIRSKNWHESAAWITNNELLSRHAQQLDVSGENIRVLDVCCGSGVVGASFKGKVGKITGLDLTPEMINLAKTRLDEVHQGTVYNIPFADGTFDVVCTREVLHLLPTPEKPVSEIFRVLRPGGQFIVGQILPFGPEDAVWMYRVFKKKQPLIFNMFQEEDFRQLLLGAGFVDLKMTEYNLWESIDIWINTHETSSLHRAEIRDLFLNAPEEAKAIHPFKILPSGEIQDLWRWCIFSVKKPSS